MTPEEKCVSLETARKLKAAGFPQDTERWYMEGGTLLSADDIDGGHYHIEVDEGLFTAAPDAQEIGEVLPVSLDGMDEINTLRLSTGSWQCNIPCRPKLVDCNAEFYGHNEAEARAAAWLWLKENNLL